MTNAGCVGNQNQAVQRGFHFQAKARGQCDFITIKQPFENGFVEVVLFNWRADAVGFAFCGKGVKFAMFFDANAFAKPLAFTNIDFQKAVYQ